MTELDIANGLAAGLLPSPFEYFNSALYRVRISGTGVRWRPAAKEFVFRSPDIWLSDEMQERVRGLPVIAEHPAGKVLDGDSFYNRIVGIVTFGFVENDELWGVVRVIDARARAILDGGAFDTSPAVLFDAEQNTTLPVDGEELLVEENPALLDHLALVDTRGGNKGVWTKPGDDPGVEITETPTP